MLGSSSRFVVYLLQTLARLHLLVVNQYVWLRVQHLMVDCVFFLISNCGLVPLHQVWYGSKDQMLPQCGLAIWDFLRSGKMSRKTSVYQDFLWIRFKGPNIWNCVHGGENILQDIGRPREVQLLNTAVQSRKGMWKIVASNVLIFTNGTKNCKMYQWQYSPSLHWRYAVRCRFTFYSVVWCLIEGNAFFEFVLWWTQGEIFRYFFKYTIFILMIGRVWKRIIVVRNPRYDWRSHSSAVHLNYQIFHT